MPPHRILFLRPDAYGDLFVFEPVPRLMRLAWPQAEVAVLIREPYLDATALIAVDGVRWLTTACNPYREGPGDNPAALDALRETVCAFAPDCLVAACSEQTWLEAAVAEFLPDARQVSAGPGLTDPHVRAALDEVLPVDWTAIYPEKIPIAPEWSEWEKNLTLADALLGHSAPRSWPIATVPETGRAQATQILANAGLTTGEFVACAAAGTANVQIKSWPAEHYGEMLAWLEREHGIRALLIGHVAEREHLAAVLQVARREGAEPALWLGQDGEMSVAAGLLSAARFYFGNDTGALHLAAALGRPVVPVFGGGHWPRFQPMARRALSVVQPLPCFGCGWDCYFGDAPCVRTISPVSVRNALEQFLQGEAAEETVFRAEGLDDEARALIDTATPRLRFQREDSLDRLRQVRLLAARATELGERLQSSEADRSARLLQIEELSARLQETDADRSARLLQIEEFSTRLQETEADRAARLLQIEELGALLQESEADRAARLLQIEELGARLQETDADRAGCLLQIKELSTRLQETAADPSARGKPALSDASQTIFDDLQQRLQGAQAQALVARNVAHQLSRERALMRRLLKFFCDGSPRVAPAAEIQCSPAVLLTEE